MMMNLRGATLLASAVLVGACSGGGGGGSAPVERSPTFDRYVDRFEAIAEIRLGDGPMPNGNLRAFDAREVIARIGPRVKYPGDD